MWEEPLCVGGAFVCGRSLCMWEEPLCVGGT